MTPLLWLSGLRHLLRHPWQMALSVLGITIGVAIVVAIDLGNQSAKRAFDLSSDAVSGKATHQILGGPGGLPEEIYTELRVELGIRGSAPVVEGYAYLEDGRVLRILGVEPFADSQFRPYIAITPNSGTMADAVELLTTPSTALMSVETADSLGLSPGNTIVLDVASIERNVRLVGLIEPENSLSAETLENLLITDISTAQELTSSEGYLSHIDLIVPGGKPGQLLLERLWSALPPETTVLTPSTRSEAVEQLTASFDQNLFMISLLGLIVGAFLIYNAMTFSVVQRRPVIGSLRAIGVTRQQIFALVLTESALIGLVSSVLGVLLGIVIGRGLVDVITQTITDLFYVASVQEVSVPISTIAKGALLGVLATIGAAFIPALEATRVPAREALSRSHLESRFRGTVPLASVIGLGAMVVGCGLVLLPVGTLWVSFLGLAALILGGALLTPASVVLFSRVLAPVLSLMFGALGGMAARGISSSISRTAVAIAALSVAISVTISIDTMVHSFRDTVEQWLDDSLGSDIYISPASLRSYQSEFELAPGALERIRDVEEVGSVRTVRNSLVNSPEGEVRLIATDADLEVFVERQSFKEGDPELVWRALQTGDAIAVSEPFAYRNDKGIGSTVRLSTADGDKDFRVAGIYYDYGSTGKGRVMMSRAAYVRHWGDDRYSGVAVDAAMGVSVDELIARLESAIGNGQGVVIRSNADLKAAALEVFERSFAITNVVRILAVLVAFIGVLGALMAIQLERSVEFGTLRVIGFTPGQVWIMFTSQSGLMGVVAGLLSVPLGLIEAAVLIFVINRKAFGWTMEMQVYPMTLAQAALIAVVAALLAGVYPAFRMSRSSPAGALQEE